MFRSATRLSLFFAIPLMMACVTKAPVQPSAPIVSPPLEAPAPASPPKAEAQPARVAPPPAPKPFDPATVTQEVKKATFEDAKSLVEKLNAIIQAKDFAAWKTYLTPAYIAYYSDPVVLSRLS
ncbi:MAG: hypothetical protein M0001_07075, partial [Treponema sp.]|nr:hypothetical protein [Treponema sp.]